MRPMHEKVRLYERIGEARYKPDKVGSILFRYRSDHPVGSVCTKLTEAQWLAQGCPESSDELRLTSLFCPLSLQVDQLVSRPAKKGNAYGCRRSPGADSPPTGPRVRGQPIRFGRQPPRRKPDGPGAKVRTYLRTRAATRLARHRVEP